MSMTPETQSEAHPAVAYDCPFCGAHAGQECHSLRGSRGEVRPHMRRVREWWAATSPQNGCELAPESQALCCECGQLRTFKQARNMRGWWGDPTWHRDVCDLKCSACGRVTTHALVSHSDNRYRDVDELRQRVALGDDVPDGWGWDAARLRQQYRQGTLPRNPYLHHLYWVGQAERAWAEGRRTVTALCGAPMALHREPSASARAASDYLEPEEFNDTEYEDPDTGLWWADMDCVDCLRVANEYELRRQRKELALQLTQLAMETEELDAATVRALREHVESLTGDGRDETGTEAR
ncbi:zinc finger domain-containing protein [Mycobacterium colombiense]|uniref:zinc finger domain-containing protein n=1 Tax=Mycobacterium colombiense TaxID=339268 RepID=UPI00114E163D|nr:hypothetical protein [Mycobacterium colombiense]